jgi:hypothetical protein
VSPASTAPHEPTNGRTPLYRRGSTSTAGIRTPALGIRGRFRQEASHALSRSPGGFAADPSRRVSPRLGPSRPAGSERRCSAVAASGAVRGPPDGCLIGRRGPPLAYSAGRRRVGSGRGSCASPRAMAGTANPSLVQVNRSDLSTEPTHNPKVAGRSCLSNIFQRLDDTATLFGGHADKGCRRRTPRPGAGAR